ncbi:MAG: T9SS type A sorting domain-containing protein [Saprospiraceae bacterium]|nr:T9SS type A sorting domain-containing protein [Saprospiraceae bacterium]
MKKQITLLLFLLSAALYSQTFSVDIELIQKVVCENLNVGTIKAKPVNISGSFTLFTYKWSNNEVTQTITNLAPATYSVTVTGHRSAPPFTIVKTKSFTLLYEPKISYTQDVIKTCGNEFNGAVDINPSGGVAPYTYSWKNIFVTGVKTGTSMPAKDLAPGTFAFTITDNNGCSRVASLTVGKRPQIEVNETITHVKCFGESTGNINLTISPFGVYQFKWSNGQITPNLKNIPAGNYKATITAVAGEADGCNVNTNVYQVKHLADKIKLEHSVLNEKCYQKADGEINTSLTGGKDPISYLWNTGATTSSIKYLSGGYYSVTATDSYGCNVVTSDIFVKSARDVKILTDSIVHKFGNNGGHIYLTPHNTIEPIEYTWINSQNQIISTEQDLVNQPAGKYVILMRDDDGFGCKIEKVYEILQLTAVDKTILEKMKVYYSQSDQKVHFKYLENIEIKSMSIYDLQGKQILYFPNPQDIDEVDFSDIPMGLYVLQVETALGQASVKISKISRE